MYARLSHLCALVFQQRNSRHIPWFSFGHVVHGQQYRIIGGHIPVRCDVDILGFEDGPIAKVAGVRNGVRHRM